MEKIIIEPVEVLQEDGHDPSKLKEAVSLRAKSIKRVFKGSVETSKEKVERMQESFWVRKEIGIRPQERILFGTKVYLRNNDMVSANVHTHFELAIAKGLRVHGSLPLLSEDNEILLLVHNDNGHLVKLTMEDDVAIMMFDMFMKVEHKTEENETV